MTIKKRPEVELAAKPLRTKRFPMAYNVVSLKPSADTVDPHAWYRAALAEVASPKKSGITEAEARELSERLFFTLSSAASAMVHSSTGDLSSPNTEKIYDSVWRDRNTGRGGRRTLYNRTWHRRWPHASPFIFAIGIVPKASSYSVGTGPSAWRLAVRVQSPMPLQESVRSEVTGIFDEWCDGLASVRFTAPAEILTSDPLRSWKPWSGPKGPRFAVGAPVSIIGGGVGALALLFRHDHETYALTSGHVISDGGRGGIGWEVFCPPQDERNEKFHLGTVSQLRTLQRRPLLAPDSFGHGVRTPDFATLLLHDQAHPEMGKARLVGEGNMHCGRLAILPLQQGDKVAKVAARTGLASGTVVATGVYLEAQDPISGMMYFANNVVEMVINSKSQVLGGDSGALVYRMADGVNEPVGMILAGVREGRLRADEKKAQIAYIMPLAGLDLPAGLELV